MNGIVAIVDSRCIFLVRFLQNIRLDPQKGYNYPATESVTPCPSEKQKQGKSPPFYVWKRQKQIFVRISGPKGRKFKFCYSIHTSTRLEKISRRHPPPTPPKQGTVAAWTPPLHFTPGGGKLPPLHFFIYPGLVAA